MFILCLIYKSFSKHSSSSSHIFRYASTYFLPLHLSPAILPYRIGKRYIAQLCTTKICICNVLVKKGEPAVQGIVLIVLIWKGIELFHIYKMYFQCIRQKAVPVDILPEMECAVEIINRYSLKIIFFHFCPEQGESS